MPLAEGVRWGWTSPATIGCAFGGLVVLGVWFALERRIGQPLVPTEMLTRRPVLFTHLAGLLVGAGMFVNVTAVMYFDAEFPRGRPATASTPIRCAPA